MAKSQNFSIYLLKVEFNPDNALKDGHNMALVTDANRLPEGAVMYIADNHPKQPWWKSYWGVNNDLYQVLKGALVFLPVAGRWVTLTFGMTFYKLKDVSYEYDFGIITTLNALDPDKIRSADLLKPENARRQRIQMPSASSLNYFDFQQDENIIRKLTGYVKEEYSELFKNVTGSASLSITTKKDSNDIISLCEEILEIYNKEDYKESFPGINNVAPIKDPEIIQKLDAKLLDSFHEEGFDLVLAIPEIIDYSNVFKIKFSGAGRLNNEFNDVYIGAYREYLSDNNFEIETADQFVNHRMKVIDENGNIEKEYSIYKCFLFDCELEGKYYHLCEGDWYSVETDFIVRLSRTLNLNIVSEYSILTECTVHSEKEYNLNIANANENVYCLDRDYIISNGRIEPCDLLTLKDNLVNLIHIKISTRSASLSHLFNQGVNSVSLLRSEDTASSRLKSLVNNDDILSDLIDRGAFKVVYGIISKKGSIESDDPSSKLPLFSRISLMRAINDLRVMSIPCEIYFIPDEENRR